VVADAGAQITEVKADDHACLTFGEAEELFDLTARYVRDGLAGGSKAWVSASHTRLAASRPVTLRCLPEIAAGFARLAWRGRRASGW
jgi:hypothetical protein